ncbi:hypothetical protein CC80DRAFT_224725 [Byssothecium circinans]|uniref:Uncharacterized protein n=1 Tax=Byssothecium circinans TaxID=147558 RepID=A0A6A5TD25_9PLEO|nr:hypothetical protein CC80DRAFT_224725 [Byssothecium circinans]
MHTYPCSSFQNTTLYWTLPAFRYIPISQRVLQVPLEPAFSRPTTPVTIHIFRMLRLRSKAKKRTQHLTYTTQTKIWEPLATQAPQHTIIIIILGGFFFLFIYLPVLSNSPPRRRINVRATEGGPFI